MVDIFMNKTTAIFSGIVAGFAYILGDHWILFACYLLLNIGDYISGNIWAWFAKEISSKKGLAGLLKKVAYWILIACGFGLNIIFVEIGEVIGLDLGFTSLIGWLILASLIVNEYRSILENLVRIPNFKVPQILIKGLSIAERAIDDVSDASIPNVEDSEEKKKE